MRISPQIMLKAIGDFSEARYLSLFGAVDRRVLEDQLRHANPVDWGKPGKLKMEDFVAPLDRLEFPRRSFADFAWAVNGPLDARNPFADPLITCYVSALAIYAEAHDVVMVPEGLPDSCALLYGSLGALGFYYRLESAKFLLWFHDLACAPSERDLDPRLILATYAFLLLGECLVDFGETCETAIYLKNPACDGSPLTRRSSSQDLANETFTKAVSEVAGPDGRVVKMLRRLSDLALYGKR